MNPPAAAPGSDELVARQVWFAHLKGSSDIRDMSLSDTQWTMLAREAVRHQLGSLTYRLLADGPLASRMPETVRQGLRARYLDYALRNAVLLRRTAEMAAELAKAGIPVMLLKGVHLCRFVYAEPALRTMADVDLMVPRARLADAERVFLAMGFGPVPRPDLERFCTWSNHLAKLHKEGAPVVEVHWSIERPTSPFQIDLEGLWQRARPARLENADVLLLAPEDVLLHLALHGSYHHGFGRSGLKALIDVNAVVTRHGSDLDWETMAARANQWGAGGFVYATLRLAGEILATPIPEGVFHRLQHTADDDAVVETAKRFVLLPEVDLPNRYLALATSGGVKERLRLMLDATFLPRRAMEAMYHLKPGSVWVYPAYVRRIVDLLWRRGGLLVNSLFRTTTVQPALTRGSDRSRIGEWVRRAGGVGSVELDDRHQDDPHEHHPDEIGHQERGRRSAGP